MNLYSRRALLATGAGALAAAALPACSSGPSADASRIEFWSQLAGSKKDAGIALETSFTESFPDVTLATNLYGSPEQLNQRLLTGFVGGILPDLFIQHWDYSLHYASGGKLLPLDEELKAANVNPRFAAYGTLKEQVVTAPLYGTTRALLINREIVSEAGIDPDEAPTTWEEIRQWSRELVRWQGDSLQIAGLHVYANDLELFEAFALFLQGAGGAILDADATDVAFDSDAGIAAAEFLRTLVMEDQVTVPGFGIGDSSNAPFPSGRAAFAITGNYAIGGAQSASIDVGAAMIPGYDGGFTSIIDPFSFGIPIDTDAQETSLNFVRHALETDSQVAFAKASRNIPVTPEAIADPGIAGDPLLGVFAQAVEHAPENAPANPAFSRVYLTIARSLQNMFFADASPEDAVRKAAKQVRPFVQEGNLQ